jgi:nucleoside-diphosphate-sugar epimerase
MGQGAGTGHRTGGRILIVGCGDVGQRVVRLIGPRWRVFALARDTASHAGLRAAGATPIPGDLDDPASLTRLAGLAPWVIHLAPPQATGNEDRRTRHLFGALGSVERLVYVSTTGVYGDCQGAAVDETRRVNPQTARAQRRVDAELSLRHWARRRGVRLAILRTPGIYAANRLPLERLVAATPIPIASEDVYTNHIHADDLARLIVAALYRAAPLRIYHASDSSELLMGDYFEMVADALGLARPPRLARNELAARVSPSALSFMQESRRIGNARALGELAIGLTYPHPKDGLAALPSSAKRGRE